MRCPSVLSRRCYPSNSWGALPCADLVAQVLGGATDAEDELARRIIEDFVPRIVGSWFAGRPELLDDVALETWLLVRLSLQTWGGRAPFCVWVRVIARHAAARVLRQFPPVPQPPPGGAPAARATFRWGPACVVCIAQAVSQFKPHQQWAWYRYHLTVPRPTQEGVAQEVGVTRRSVITWLAAMNDAIRGRCSAHCQ
jgi:hypothetical protein